MKKIILLLIVGLILATNNSYSERSDSKIKSYDTTYYEGGFRYRQIYVNDTYNKKETYILIKFTLDSIVVFNKVWVDDYKENYLYKR